MIEQLDKPDLARTPPIRRDTTVTHAADHPLEDLHPTRLLRGANGHRPTEAAIVLLADTDLLGQLTGAIEVGRDHQTAWMNWDAAVELAGWMTDKHSAVVLLAAAVAREGDVVSAEYAPAFQAAFDHLTT